MSKINSALPLVIATGPHGLVGKALRASLPDLAPLDVVARLAYPYGATKTPATS